MSERDDLIAVIYDTPTRVGLLPKSTTWPFPVTVTELADGILASDWMKALKADVRKGALVDALPEDAKWFPDEGGIMWQGEAYYPANYVLTRTDIQELRKAALEEAAQIAISIADREPDGYYGQACFDAARAIRAAALGDAPTGGE